METTVEPLSEPGSSYRGWPANHYRTMNCAGVEKAVSPQDRRTIYNQRRVKSPSKGAVESSTSRYESVGSKPGAPIPTCAKPAWAIPTVININPCCFYIGLGQIIRAQAAPA